MNIFLDTLHLFSFLLKQRYTFIIITKSFSVNLMEKYTYIYLSKGIHNIQLTLHFVLGILFINNNVFNVKYVCIISG